MDDMTIVSTRIRLARNIKGLPFPHILAELPSRRVADDVAHVLGGTADKYARYDMKSISQLDGTILQEKHLISHDLLTDCPFGSVLINADESVSVMVNEEDHIREQVILPGLALDRAYDRVNAIDDLLGRNLEFAFSDRFGYLTSCATNLGTGMRASVMLFLPGLTMTNRIDSCINDVGRINITVRGVYGEGSKADGYLYQISNQHTLGMTEREIIDGVKSAINHIVEAELNARKMLKSDEPALIDSIFRAWGVATNAYKMTTEEAMKYLAMIRLGAYYGYIDVESGNSLQNLVTACQPANMQRLGSRNISVDERDILRARFVSSKLKSIAQKVNFNGGI